MPDLLDVYEGDPVLAPAFIDLVCWASRQPDAVAAFEAETGMHCPAAPRTPLDAMIDEATGAVDAYVMGFAGWVFTSMWGGAVEPE